MYIRSSISAQSQASVPPAPAWMVTKALQWSLGPPSIDRSSNASKSASARLTASRISSSNSSISASSASSIEAARSSACLTSSSKGLSTELSVFSSAMMALAFSWSFQKVGLSMSRARASRRACFSPKSKRVS